MDWWSRLTGDPRLREIDPFVVATFVRELGKAAGRKSDRMAASTVRKHVRQLQTVLDLAGPKTRQRPEALGLLNEVPFLKQPRADLEPPAGDFTMDEIHNIYRSAAFMSRPDDVEGVKPADWWRVLVVTATTPACGLAP